MTAADFAALEREYLAARQLCADLREKLDAAEQRAYDLGDEYHRERRRREAGAR